jgi:hypothetical protein
MFRRLVVSPSLGWRQETGATVSGQESRVTSDKRWSGKAELELAFEGVKLRPLN